jgi:hypothetical protein
MQTRKRAKSVTFGKKEGKKEKEAIKKAPEETPVEESKKSSEKAEVVERRTVPEKPQSEELSSTLPKEEEVKEEKETPTKDIETPKDDIVTDTSPVDSSDSSHESTSKDDSASSEGPSLSESAQPIATPPPVTGEISQPLETSPQATSSVQPPSQEGQELSSTLPPSAFTIQNGEPEIINKPEEGKRRFGIYFFVVAFLAFILGLGAMAAVSYFGLINLSLPKISIPHNISVPGLSAKATPTPLPKPTAAPTAAPVNLKAYSVSVLNGSGITGQAGKVKDSLTTDGFNVPSTGNADNSNYTKTEIAAKKSVSQAYLSKLEDELGKTLNVDTTVGSLEDSSTTDVTVTLGSQTAQ